MNDMEKAITEFLNYCNNKPTQEQETKYKLTEKDITEMQYQADTDTFY